jgi:glycosyltransferase involved in cell wall biosynthesis
MTGIPFVSVIIPCRNEEDFIETVLQNVIAQDYPYDKLEVFVVDGASTDKTKDIAYDLAVKYPFIHVLDNPEKIVPYALNLGIRESRGEVIVRMDAHSEYPADYISSLVKNLFELNADNVGGVWITQPADSSLMAQAIAAATSHLFGIGNALYRLGASAPKQVDTVPFGCYRREVFDKIGLFDEQLIRNQDDEFNGRLIKKGGKIFLIPSVKIKYFARNTLGKLAKMFYQYGLFKPLVNNKLGFPATLRQIVPPIFVFMVIALLAFSFLAGLAVFLFILVFLFYLAANILFSLYISVKSRIILFPFLLITFPVIHFSYGYGYLKGIVKFVWRKQHMKMKTDSVPINR